MFLRTPSLEDPIALTNPLTQSHKRNSDLYLEQEIIKLLTDWPKDRHGHIILYDNFLFLDDVYEVSVHSKDKIEMLPRFNGNTLLCVKWRAGSYVGQSWDTDRIEQSWKDSHAAQEWPEQPLIVANPIPKDQLVEQEGIDGEAEDVEPKADATASSHHDTKATTPTPTAPTQIANLNAFFLFMTITQLPLTLLFLAFVDGSSLYFAGCAFSLVLVLLLRYCFRR